MITLYTMIAEPEELTLQSHFYQVQVGTSKAAQRAVLILNGYCRSQSFYFVKRSHEDDVFRLKVAESLGCKVYELPCMIIKAEKLISYLRNHNCLPWQPVDSGNLRHLMELTQPTFFLSCNTKCLKRGTY